MYGLNEVDTCVEQQRFLQKGKIMADHVICEACNEKKPQQDCVYLKICSYRIDAQRSAETVHVICCLCFADLYHALGAEDKKPNTCGVVSNPDEEPQIDLATKTVC